MSRWRDTPVDEIRVATEAARRRSRYRFARERIRKLVEADPPFTEDERRELAALLVPGAAT